jgi:hypothetical protein
MSAGGEQKLGDWLRQKSRSTGNWYWFNVATRQAVWEDVELPPGWAWGKDSEAGAKWFINLHTGHKQAEKPSAAAVTEPAKASLGTSASGASAAVDGTALALTAALTAGDDLVSTAYIPDESPTVRGANLPAAVASKRDYLFSSVPPEVRWRLQVDEVALYSITEARLAERQSRLMLDLCGGPGITVTDATACVGGNTLSFARHFAHVNAVELSAQRARMLAHNAAVCGVGAKVSVHHADYLQAMGALRQDVVFFDPPWGGPEYKSAASLDMFLGRTDVADVIAALTCPAPATAAGAGSGAAGGGAGRPLARWVVLKAPTNYNVAGLRAKLEQCGSGASVTHVEEQWKMLLLVVTAGTTVPRVLPPLLQSCLAQAEAAARAKHTASGIAAPVAPLTGVKRPPPGAAADGAETGSAPAAKRTNTTHETSLGSVGAALQLLLPVRVRCAASAAGEAGVALLPAGCFLAPNPVAAGAAEELCTQPKPHVFRWSAASESSAVLGGFNVACSDMAASPSLLLLLHATVAQHGAQGTLLLRPRSAVAAAGPGAEASGLLCLCAQGLPPPPDSPSAALRLLSAAPAGSPAEPSPWSSLSGLRVAWRPLSELLASAPDTATGGEAQAAADLVQRAVALAARASRAGADAGVWAPLFLSPAVSLPLRSLVAESGAGAGAAPVARALGIPALVGEGLAGKGARGEVVRVRCLTASAGPSAAVSSCGLPAAPLVAKLQPLDARVKQEVAVGLLLAAAARSGTNAAAVSTGPPAAAGDAAPPIALPLLAWESVAGPEESCVVYRHAGASLEELLPALPAGGAAGGGESGGGHGRLPLRQVAVVLDRVLAALQLLHGQGLLYCDLHPGNIMVQAAQRPAGAARSGGGADPAAAPHGILPASACLIDLGSVQPLAPAAAGSAAAPFYHGPSRGGRWDTMAPEQFGPQMPYATGLVTLTPAADTFAAAATAAHLLAGVAPFSPTTAAPGGFAAWASGGGLGSKPRLTVAGTRDHPFRASPALLEQHLRACCRGDGSAAAPTGGSAPGSAEGATEAGAVAAVLLRAMQPDPASRFVSASDMREALHAALPGLLPALDTAS